MTSDRWPKRPASRCRSGRAGAPVRPGQGRRDALAELRHDALLRADRRARRRRHARPAAAGRRWSARSSGCPWTASCPPTTRCSRSPAELRACRSSPAATTSGHLRRRSTRSCASSRSRWLPTARAPTRVARLVVRGAGRGGRPGRARGRQLAAGEVRAARRRPELGPDPPGGRPGGAGRRPVAARALHRGGARRERRRRRGARRGRAGRLRARRWPPPRWRCGSTSLPPARRPRSSSATSGPSTCASTRSTRHEHATRTGPQDRGSRRCSSRSLHPGVLRAARS